MHGCRRRQCRLGFGWGWPNSLGRSLAVLPPVPVSPVPSVPPTQPGDDRAYWRVSDPRHWPTGVAAAWRSSGAARPASRRFSRNAAQFPHGTALAPVTGPSACCHRSKPPWTAVKRAAGARLRVRAAPLPASRTRKNRSLQNHCRVPGDLPTRGQRKPRARAPEIRRTGAQILHRLWNLGSVLRSSTVLDLWPYTARCFQLQKAGSDVPELQRSTNGCRCSPYRRSRHP